jgi:hypothetical protein
MTLRTDDIIIATDDWVEIQLLNGGTYVSIADVKFSDVVYKIGTEGDSDGISFRKSQDNTVISPVSIYVKRTATRTKPTVVVVRDYI